MHFPCSLQLPAQVHIIHQTSLSRGQNLTYNTYMFRDGMLVWRCHRFKVSTIRYHQVSYQIPDSVKQAIRHHDALFFRQGVAPFPLAVGILLKNIVILYTLVRHTLQKVRHFDSRKDYLHSLMMVYFHKKGYKWTKKGLTIFIGHKKMWRKLGITPSPMRNCF